MEKIKDILHDYTDVLLAMVITAAMVVVLVWNLGSWFDKDSNIAVADIPEPILEENIPTNNDPIAVIEDNDDEDDIKVEEPQEPEDSQDPQDSETSEPEVESPSPTPPITVVEIKKITIPNGTPGVGIARILLENELISDVNDFVKVSEELNLSLKLKSGTFEVSTDSSVEDMVRIIAGQK